MATETKLPATKNSPYSLVKLLHRSRKIPNFRSFREKVSPYTYSRSRTILADVPMRMSRELSSLDPSTPPRAWELAYTPREDGIRTRYTPTNGCVTVLSRVSVEPSAPYCLMPMYQLFPALYPMKRDNVLFQRVGVFQE